MSQTIKFFTDIKRNYAYSLKSLFKKLENSINISRRFSAERHLREAILSRKPCDLSVLGGSLDPNASDMWPSERRLRGEDISSILIGIDAQKSASSGGVEIIGARIEGSISLCGAIIKERIVFRNCHFIVNLNDDNSNFVIDMTDSRLHTIQFNRCLIEFSGEKNKDFIYLCVNLDRSNLDGSILFTRSIFNSSISAIGANIKGDFSLSGSKIMNSSSLFADRIRVDGQIFLRGGFECDGSVALSSAKIGSNLDFSNSILGEISKESPAVRLNGASIGGFCSFFNSKVYTSGPISIDASSSIIRTWVNVSGTFHAIGGVRFRGAKIGNNFNADGGYFRINKKYRSVPSIDLEAAEIGGSVLFRNRSMIIGQVMLFAVKITNNLIFQNFRIANPGLTAIHAELSRIGGHVFVKGGKIEIKDSLVKRPASIRGGINFMAANIGGSFRIYFVRVVTSNSGWDKDLQRILFNRIRISGTLSILQTRFSAPKDGVRPADVRFINAKVYALVDDQGSWPELGCLVLDGFEYEQITRQDSDKVNGGNRENHSLWEERLAWLLHQKSSHIRENFRPQPFNQLINVLRRMGHDDDARKISIQKQKFARLSRPVLKRLPSYFMGASCGYGYRPWLALIWMAALITLGGILFDHTRNHFSPVRGNLSSTENTFSPWLYSADVFIPIISLQQKDRWTPILELSDACESDERYYWALISWIYRPLHTIFGWFFGTLFVAGVGGLIRKD